MPRTLILTAIACSTLAQAAPPDPSDHPNVVIIVSDDMGWEDVSYHGASLKTPNIGRIGRVLTSLDDQKMTRDTITIFFCDNGAGNRESKAELFNVKNDPGEKTDLAVQEKNLVEKLKSAAAPFAEMLKSQPTRRPRR